MEPTVWNNQGGAYDYEKSELQSILDAITEPLILINSDFSIKRVNRASLEFTGENAFRSVLNRKC
ncbi:MAG: PAS domain-containing protein, partial [Leptospira sp.]|nr:PAS domain-containing protein [Leptospira sp.]